MAEGYSFNPLGEIIEKKPEKGGNGFCRKETLGKVPFEGFTAEQEIWVRRAVECVGLALNRVTAVEYRPNQEDRKNVLAQVHQGTGEMTLFKLLGTLPERAQAGTIIHELAHLNDPFNPDNADLFGSAEAREAACRHALAIAEQTANTGIYLNGYHRLLCQWFRDETITREKFAKETHAIMIELRFTNYKHLLEVQRAQRIAVLAKRGQFTALVSETDATETVGVDKTLIHLMPKVGNLEGLRAHITQVRDSFSPNPNEKGPLARGN